METSNSNTIILLVILLILLNGKAIVTYVLWLRFKIKTHFNQLENERNSNDTAHRRSSAV
jgi:hypothetical protein